MNIHISGLFVRFPYSEFPSKVHFPSSSEACFWKFSKCTFVVRNFFILPYPKKIIKILFPFIEQSASSGALNDFAATVVWNRTGPPRALMIHSRDGRRFIHAAPPPRVVKTDAPAGWRNRSFSESRKQRRPLVGTRARNAVAVSRWSTWIFVSWPPSNGLLRRRWFTYFARPFFPYLPSRAWHIIISLLSAPSPPV